MHTQALKFLDQLPNKHEIRNIMTTIQSSWWSLDPITSTLPSICNFPNLDTVTFVKKFRAVVSPCYVERRHWSEPSDYYLLRSKSNLLAPSNDPGYFSIFDREDIERNEPQFHRHCCDHNSFLKETEKDQRFIEDMIEFLRSQCFIIKEFLTSKSLLRASGAIRVL
jgi:hypothetical protein